MYKERKETTHGEIGEKVITTLLNIYIYIYIDQMNTRFAITRWPQDQCTRTRNLKDKEKKKIQKSSLPLTKISYTNSPPKYMTTLIPKTTPPFCHE